MQVSVIGIDLGKNTCSLVGLDAAGKVSLRRRFRREVVTSIAALPKCLVAMEACCGAHHIGRALAEARREVRGAVDVSGACAPVRQSSEERRP
jgi:transposase